MSRTYKVGSLDQAESYIDQLMRSKNAMEQQIRNVENNSRNIARQEANRRAQELQVELDSLEYRLQDELSNVQADVAQKYTEHRLELQRTANQIQADVAQRYDEHKRDLEQQADDFDFKLSDLEEKMEEDLENLTEIMNNRFEVQQSQIEANKKNLDTIFNREKDLNKQAIQRIQTLEVILNSFNKGFNHDKYANGKYNQLVRRYNDLKDLPSQSAIGQASEITNKVKDLEFEITRDQAIFETIYSSTLEKAEEVLETMSKNKDDLYFTDENGAEKKNRKGERIQVEVDFWTEDEYSKLENKVQEIKDILIKDKETVKLDTDQLDQYKKELLKIKKEQEELVFVACEKGMLSEQRAKNANDIYQAFKQQGFWLKNGKSSFFYEGNLEKQTENDFREGIAINLLNRIGTELTVRIVPNGRQNIVHFHRNDNRNMTAQEYIKMLSQVQSIIESSGKGYKMGQLQAPNVGDVKIEELADMNALKRGVNNKTRNIQ